MNIWRILLREKDLSHSLHKNSFSLVCYLRIDGLYSISQFFIIVEFMITHILWESFFTKKSYHTHCIHMASPWCVTSEEWYNKLMMIFLDGLYCILLLFYAYRFRDHIDLRKILLNEKNLSTLPASVGLLLGVLP